jgi:flagellar motor protein MotB
MYDESEEEGEISYWPSVSDLFLTLFVVSLVLVAVVNFVLRPKSALSSDRAVIESIGTDMKAIREPVNQIREELGGRPALRPTQTAKEVVVGLNDTAGDTVAEIRKLKLRVAELEKRTEALGSSEAEAKRDVDNLRQALNDKPPIIEVEESEVRRFKSGSAAMDDQFRNGLWQSEFKTLAQEILKRNAGQRRNVDTLEVIGHTDGQPVGGGKGNLDEALPLLLSGENGEIDVLKPGSNNDLGLMRALALKRAWRDFVTTQTEGRQELESISVRCYSAGQTLPANEAKNHSAEAYREPNEKSRRIEIRLTKLR